MKQSDVERFAVAQALYSKLGEFVATGGKGELRAELDDALRDAMDWTGANRIEIRLGGELVGELSATTQQCYVVDDFKAQRAWAEERGLVNESRYIDALSIEALPPEDYAEVLDWLEEHYPSTVVKRSEVSNMWSGHVVHRGELVFDANTGEQLDWCRFVTKVASTKLSGCKWDKPPAKFCAVSKALPNSELSTSGLAGLLGGGVDG